MHLNKLVRVYNGMNLPWYELAVARVCIGTSLFLVVRVEIGTSLQWYEITIILTYPVLISFLGLTM